ncbi:MAG: SpoIIE family protein phosphatase [Turneriella sp.]|nr:SpoIIE family protein phosphatase [Turneriella sp.]
MPPLYPNYFFVGSLIIFLFLLYVLWLLYRIPDRSPASTQLAITMLLTAIFSLSYIITHGFYNLPNFYTRWLNFYSAPAAGLHAAAFFHCFPRVRSPRALKAVLFFGHLSIFLVCGYLAYVMAKSPLYYLFNAHLWDSDSLPVQKQVSVFILLHFIHFIATGVWRGFVEKKENRYGAWLITAAFLVATIPPVILQVLSRDNLVPRSTYMIAAVIFNLVGYFFAIVTYINVTQDRTSILGRITGITLLAVLLIFQAVAYFWLHDVEKSYDTVHYGQSREGYALGQLPQKAVTQMIYDHNREELVSYPGTDYAPAEHLRQEAQATFLLSELARLDTEENIRQKAPVIIERASRYSPIQVAYLKHMLTKYTFHSGIELVQKIQSLQRLQLYQIAKLRQLPLKEFAKTKEKILAAIDSRFPGFAEGAKPYLHEEAEKLREIFIRALTPWRAEGERLYRGEIYLKDKFPRHYVAYPFVDVAKRRVVEVAFPYEAYRKEIAEETWPLVITIVLSYFFILIGFSLFFRGALMQPINALVAGLKEIRNNNFDARVQLRVEDEFGFMAKSFNRMARSIKAGRMRLQKYAEQLEEKVKERTQELQQSLREVQALKTQQDGDYFLTTLLLKPLGVSEVDSRYFRVESYVRQKKKFEFRHWSKEIGGDINIAHVIELGGKRHIAVINADAMGKSIQGAGGALVLGSVFHTIIERTIATEAMQQLSPERWLKNAFLELHRVFESFDGSMLVSGFFALIDEQSGLMYHLLAEHPQAVLIRDGKASFIESNRLLRKLGTTGVEGTLVIETTQLEPGDIVIAGSDGRDDIILGYDEYGSRIINEDENLFLSIAEKCGGDIALIVQELERRGEIMDDLSLIRIERLRQEQQKTVRAFDYSGVLQGVKRDLREGALQKAIQRIESYLQHDSDYPDAVKNLAQIYYQARNYQKAAYYAQDYLWLRPADTDFVFFASLCFRRIGDYRKAIELSERMRLREQPNPRNLALLADLHIRTGNLRRAEAILEELIECDPNYSSIPVLQRKLAAANRSS